MLFSWYIVGYLFLSGAGSGCLFVAAASCLWDAAKRTDRSKTTLRFVQPGFVAAPILLAFSGLFLLLDLGNVERAWMIVIMPFASVVSIGAWLVAGLTLVSGVLAVAGLMVEDVPKPLLWVCVVSGAALSVGVMSYTGLLLSGMVSIDFWRTPWLVLLFVASSLSAGVAVIVVSNMLLGRPFIRAKEMRPASGLFALVEAVALAGMLVSQRGFSATAQASCDLLLTGSLAPVFWGIVCFVGLLVPLTLRLADRSTETGELISAAATLSGSLALRYCIVAAALFTPLIAGAL